MSYVGSSEIWKALRNRNLVLSTIGAAIQVHCSSSLSSTECNATGVVIADMPLLFTENTFRGPSQTGSNASEHRLPWRDAAPFTDLGRPISLSRRVICQVNQ